MSGSIYDNIYDYFEIDAQLTGANIKSYILYRLENDQHRCYKFIDILKEWIK